MKTLFTTLAHGNEPYILAASIGKDLGDVVIPLVYPDKQEKILREWVGNSEHVYLDQGSGTILDKILFQKDYQNYVHHVLNEGREVKKELTEYLKDFESTSLAGRKKRFKKPKIELNIGSPISLKDTRSFYIFPGLVSKYAESSPITIDGMKDFVTFSKEAEGKHEMIFIPQINSFSYRDEDNIARKVSTPPLKRKGYNNDPIERSILVTLPGSSVLRKELCKVVERTKIKVYHPAADDLPGEPLNNFSASKIFFNPNVVAVLARAGWGTLWSCQVAEKPIITPSWKKTDDPEIYHNNKTVEALDLGIVYEEFTEDLIQKAVTKVDNIRQINNVLYKRFGTLDGITFVQQKIREIL